MRGLVADLRSPTPLIESLPGIYQEDALARALMQAFDEVLAPILSTLDNLEAYFDPALTPDDFLEWLTAWVGILPDETWPIERRRALVALAVQLYRKRGTAAGLAMHVRLLGAGDVDVSDSGGAVWSRTPGTAAPGDASYRVTVTVRPPKKGQVDPAKLDELVAAAKPAHVTHRITIGERSAT
ncbi:MAG: phage tail protein I [Chloroflexota bacterium]|nr:phage tail protein I [Chloroflexota bacterium]